MKLQVEDLSYAFENKNVLQNLNFSIADKEFISILGFPAVVNLHF